MSQEIRTHPYFVRAQPALLEMAENKIAKCRAEGSSVLDLSNLHLLSLPGSLSSLTALTDLDISFNLLSDLTSLQPTFSTLKHLDMQSNELTDLNSIDAFRTLEHLN